MTTTKATVRSCEKGHRYLKSSDCPVCPVCEQARVPAAAFLQLLAAPARRALEGAGILSVATLAQKRENELLALHGFGPGSLPVLREVLTAAGLSFRD
jgi:predicted RecB family nuclease